MTKYYDQGTGGGTLTTTKPFAVCYRDGVAGRWFDGKVDEVGYWNRILSTAEITSLYNSFNGDSYPFIPNITTFVPANLSTSTPVNSLNFTLNEAGGNVSIQDWNNWTSLDNPTTYYNFDTSYSGVIDDVSNHNNNGTLVGAVINTTTKLLGAGSLWCDGSNDYVNLSDVDNSFDWGANDWSVNFWVYSTQTGTDDSAIFSRQLTTTYDTLIGFQSNNNYFTTTGSSWVTNSPWVYETTENLYRASWYMKTIVRNGSQIYTYQNGTYFANKSVSMTLPSYLSAYLCGGQNGYALANIDEMGFWVNKSLSQAEITQLWNGGSGKVYNTTTIDNFNVGYRTNVNPQSVSWVYDSGNTTQFNYKSYNASNVGQAVSLSNGQYYYNVSCWDSALNNNSGNYYTFSVGTSFANPIISNINATSNDTVGSTTDWAGGVHINSDLLSITLKTDINANCSGRIDSDTNYSSSVAADVNYKFATTSTTDHAYTIYDSISVGARCLYVHCVDSTNSDYDTGSGCLNITRDASNTCSCPAINTNWNMLASDGCNITTACNLGTGILNITGTGNVLLNTSINASDWIMPDVNSFAWIGNNFRLIDS